MATVTAADSSAADTISTLKFVNRAKCIKNAAVQNEKSIESIFDLQREIASLRAELLAAKQLVPEKSPLKSAGNTPTRNGGHDEQEVC